MPLLCALRRLPAPLYYTELVSVVIPTRQVFVVISSFGSLKKKCQCHKNEEGALLLSDFGLNEPCPFHQSAKGGR